MRTTVVPAQITTVEDRIAGSLTLPQIVLLVIAMVVGALIYAVVMPKMHFGNIKMALIIIQFLFFGGLALRYHGKILGEWLVVYLRFKSRPRKYVFTKNDAIHREIIIGEEVKETKPQEKAQAADSGNLEKPLTLLEELNIGKIFDNDSLTISFKPSRKGGLDVLLEKTKS